jgi:hypothetical protein
MFGNKFQSLVFVGAHSDAFADPQTRAIDGGQLP